VDIRLVTAESAPETRLVAIHHWPSPALVQYPNYYFEPDPADPEFDLEVAGFPDPSPPSALTAPVAAAASVAAFSDEHPVSAGTVKVIERKVIANIRMTSFHVEFGGLVTRTPIRKRMSNQCNGPPTGASSCRPPRNCRAFADRQLACEKQPNA
jgi:hypothetical protein